MQINYVTIKFRTMQSFLWIAMVISTRSVTIIVSIVLIELMAVAVTRIKIDVRDLISRTSLNSRNSNFIAR